MSDSWEKPQPIANAYADWAPALTGDATSLYLAFRKSGTSEIYFAAFKDNVWTPQPIFTGIKSGAGPALAYSTTNRFLNMFWQADGGKRIDYAQINIQTGSSDFGKAGEVSSVGSKSGNGPAAVYWGNMFNEANTGDVSSSIYYNYHWDGWHEVKPNNKKSKKSPALAAVPNTLYLFHTGEGTKSKHVMWAYHDQDTNPKDGWTSDQSVPSAETKAGPGAAGWGSDRVVLCHNGKDEDHIWWHYLDVPNRKWHSMGKAGGDLHQLKTKASPALWYQPTVTGGNKEGMYMVYANSGDGSNQLNFSYLKSIS